MQSTELNSFLKAEESIMKLNLGVINEYYRTSFSFYCAEMASS